MTDYTIYSIRTFNNNNLVFYNYTKQKRINDVLSSYKSRYKRYLNKCDNFMNIFYILQADKSYIKIEEKLTTDNEDNVKSRLYEFIAGNNCINKLNTDQIEKLCNTKNNTGNKNQDKVIEEVIEEVIIEPKTEVIEEVIIEPKTEVIETKIVKYTKEDIADISNNQVELLNDNLVEEPNITPTNIVKVVKNLADVIIDDFYEPSITPSITSSRKSFNQQIEELKAKYHKSQNKTIKSNLLEDAIKIMKNKKTLKIYKNVFEK